MDTDRDGHILYADQLLPATFVSEINLRRGEGMDTVVRDKAGRYYLHREVYKDRRGKSLRSYAPWKQRCRERSLHFLHRLSHAAMALWMIETSGGSRQVRHDAFTLLRRDPRREFTLDAFTQGLVEQHLMDHQDDPRDVVNAAVDMFLSDPHDDPPEDREQAIAWAKVRRDEADEQGRGN